MYSVAEDLMTIVEAIYKSSSKINNNDLIIFKMYLEQFTVNELFYMLMEDTITLKVYKDIKKLNTIIDFLEKVDTDNSI